MTAQELYEELGKIPGEEREGTQVYLLPLRGDAVLEELDYRKPLTNAEPWIELR